MAKVEVNICRKQVLAMLITLLCFPVYTYCQHKLIVKAVDKDSLMVYGTLGIQRNFKNQQVCIEYIYKIPELLQKKGYLNSSVDSVFADSLQTVIHLYIGETFRGAIIKTDSIEQNILQGVGLDRKQTGNHLLSFQEFESMKRKILEYLENNGYPFARIDLDSIELTNQNIYGILKVSKGPLYKIDSIRNFGTARISSNFLQRHLGILNGSIYKKEKLTTISKKLTDLPFVTEQQPWNLTLLGTGSILNLYLVPKKSSQVNVLVGFLPSNQQLNNKLLVTGEANVNLRNALGAGETIGLNWQQIQLKSPRLTILFEQPYLFNSPFGVNFNFDLLKKDSSYLNINALAGVQYAVSSNYVAGVFLQSFSTNLLTVDTFFVKNNRRLPQEADLRSLNIGINLQWFNTDYRLNPRSGNELSITASTGTKKIRKNNVIVQLHDSFDPGFNFNSLYDTFKLKSYQFRIRLQGAHFFRLTRSSTLKTALSGGIFQSPAIFRNELFQIGGYKLLRGFDEESIFASQYGVGTVEYRYLMGLNSFLFAFVDLGWAKNASVSNNITNTFIGAGLGMAFETKAGIFNISYAGGKRDDTKFNLRQSKIHIGYINYF
jgi:outer membrane protein assembly factor BamA